ncbi:MAG TPA: AbrB/MazE/SpoVT family DNA-binding domain-containing protein [Longimicrobiaceae bacterium]|nr:AbrB/MazE/SpoVT family DNA-binding domain-containing protein [Longimicrobiaceae bacterium]
MTVDSKGRATLPEDVRADLGLEQGDLLLLEKTERGTYELVPAALVPREQLWFYHPEVQARVAQAEADFREGRAARTETPDEAQALLDSLKDRPARAARRHR